QVRASHGIDAVSHTIRWKRIWDRRISPGKRLPMAFVGLSEELREYIRAWKVLEGAQMFVVPGTGLLSDAFGLSGWGPYGLFKWSLVARLRRSKVVVLSVGAGPIDSALGRGLLRAALSLAHYRSYRDLPSRTAVAGVGVRVDHDRVYPDLAFGLSPGATEVSSRPAES